MTGKRPKLANGEKGENNVAKSGKLWRLWYFTAGWEIPDM